MFTLRRQLTALTLVAASVLSVPAIAETSPQDPLEKYLSYMLTQQMASVKAELMHEVTVEVAQTTYLAEPDIQQTSLLADISIQDLVRDNVVSEIHLKGE